MEVYKTFSKELVDSLNPETPMERQLAQTVADSQWRLNRARTYEDGMLALGHDPEIHPALSDAKVFRDHSKDFVNLSLYEQRIQRAQKNAFDQLRELQTERKMVRPYPIDTEAQTGTTGRASARAKTMTAGQSTPVSADTSENGFVYSNEPSMSPQALIPGREPARSQSEPREGQACQSSFIGDTALSQ
jgi:hypothetical protein